MVLRETGQRRHTGLIGLDRAIDQSAVVVADEPVGDHHVADPQCRIEAARNAGEHERAAPELPEQQGRHQGGVDLPDARLHGDHRMAVQVTDVKRQAGDTLGALLGEMGAELRQLFGDGRDQADGL